jgi:hypothetical protein
VNTTELAVLEPAQSTGCSGPDRVPLWPLRAALRRGVAKHVADVRIREGVGRGGDGHGWCSCRFGGQDRWVGTVEGEMT